MGKYNNYTKRTKHTKYNWYVVYVGSFGYLVCLVQITGGADAIRGPLQR